MTERCSYFSISTYPSLYFFSLPLLLWCILQIWIMKQPLCCNKIPACRISTSLSDPAGLLLADALLVKTLPGLCMTSRNHLGWLKYLKLACFTNHTVARLSCIGPYSLWMLKLSSLFRVKVSGCWPPARVFRGTEEILTFFFTSFPPVVCDCSHYTIIFNYRCASYVSLLLSLQVTLP